VEILAQQRLPPSAPARPPGNGDVLTMRRFRRWGLVVLLGVLATVVVRLRAKGGVPPTTGGWRELEGPDFR
jgi:hypothetical protein